MSAPNWLGLLRWTVSHTDGTHESQFASMSEEDKLWLEKVMKEVVRDDPTRMNEIMISLKDYIAAPSNYEADAERMENELDELRDIAEQIDMALVSTLLL